MRHISITTIKLFAFNLALLIIIALGSSTARADEIRIVGGTTGLFGNTGSGSATFRNLTYQRAEIDGTTAGGTLVLASEFGTPNRNNLGSFTLGNGSFGEDYSSAFTLTIQFDLPRGVVVGNPRPITGSAFFDPESNALLIDFDNSPFFFTFSDGQNFGTFSLSLDDLLFVFGSSDSLFSTNAVTNQQRTFNCTSFPCTAALTGSVTLVSPTAAVPEPSTMLLLGTGLAAASAAVKRRRKNRTD